MRSVHTARSTHGHLALISPACLGIATPAGFPSLGAPFTHPPSCPPLLDAHYRRFTAHMGALTPAAAIPTAGLPSSPAWPSRRSAPNHQMPPTPRLHLSPAGSSLARLPAESGSSSCGPTVHLRLLSTSSHENAVTFGYRPRCWPDADSHRTDQTGPSAHWGSHLGCPRKRNRARAPFDSQRRGAARSGQAPRPRRRASVFVVRTTP